MAVYGLPPEFRSSHHGRGKAPRVDANLCLLSTRKIDDVHSIARLVYYKTGPASSIFCISQPVFAQLKKRSPARKIQYKAPADILQGEISAGARGAGPSRAAARGGVAYGERREETAGADVFAERAQEKLRALRVADT